MGLGSNVGDRRAWIGFAVQALAELPDTTLVARSSLYESVPLGTGGSVLLGAGGGGDYLNAVVHLRTRLEPLPLLGALQAIERRAGRERPYANAPRTLDCDLLLWDAAEIEHRELTLPHPRLSERAFVLMPLAEIAPGMVIPRLGPVQELVGAVAAQRLAKLDS